MSDIAEYSARKIYSPGSMLMYRMRAYFHKHMRASCIHHLFQYLIQADSIRCCMRCRHDRVLSFSDGLLVEQLMDLVACEQNVLLVGLVLHVIRVEFLVD